MNIKKCIIIILFGIVIYFVLNILYNKLVVEDDYKEVYVLPFDVKKGEEVDLSKIQKVKYKSDINLAQFSKKIDEQLLVFNNDYIAGTILEDGMVILKDDYLNITLDKEIVGIKINDMEDNLCGNIKKGDYINVYASAITSELTKIINVENVESFCAESPNSISTVKILNNVKVLNCYDMEGNILKGVGNIDSIVIEIDKNLALQINNLKEYAAFSIGMN